MSVVTRHFGYTDRSVRRKARRDGKPRRWVFWPFSSRPKPSEPTDTQPTHALFERELTQSAESAMAVLASEWQGLDFRLKPDYARTVVEQRQARDAVKKEGAESDAASAEFEKVRVKFLALEQPVLGRTASLILLAIFAISEAVFNGLVFQIFGERQAYTWLFAGGIGALLPFVGHAIGSLLKHRIKRPMDWFIIVGAPVSATGILFGVAILRGVFLETGHVRELLGYSMSIATAREIFFAFNLGLFFGAVVVGYLSSHPDGPVYVTIRKQYRLAMKAMKKESAEAEAAVERLEDADRAVALARHKRQKRYDTHQEIARLLKEKSEWFASIYRQENRAARESTVMPAPFELPLLSPALPAVFEKELEWPEDEPGKEEPRQ